ncbi:MAG TPA: excinuclease ABC subunit UvrC [Myxococcota bacterium]|nr:excinuclease ABC subunit UvrC [Myxococcota bacterium]HRY96311.1 excinuclease ABC subunit UvrC [Myxococcota bacterium]HSA20807.1 excinuclease ABC subunit UvrC [Myxococcota bacterium]
MDAARLELLLSSLPARPGVYRMLGRGRVVLYVGKAKNLRQRVRSYFRASGDARPFVAGLQGLLEELEWVVTPSEKDALALERELIHRERPRFNIDLRDDKSFLSIRLSAHRFPRLSLERRRPGGEAPSHGGRRFGPYTSAAAARETLRAVQIIFQLRTCADAVFAHRARPCLLHPLGRCLGPCCLPVEEGSYARRVEAAGRFLRGRFEPALELLGERMRAASAALRFEEAARLRDRLRAVEATLGARQVLADLDDDLDVFGLHREGASGVIQLLQVRAGRWHGALRFPFRGLEAPAADLLRQLLGQHYAAGAEVPPVVLLPAECLGEDCAEEGAGPEQAAAGEAPALEQWLGELRGGRVRVLSPRRGRRLELVRMAAENAAQAHRASAAEEGARAERLARLQRRLGLSRLPRRIECFDLSTLGGRQSVGAMAVLQDGEPRPAAYRRYRIREAATDSDVDMMREVLGRRLRPVLAGEEAGPDLVVLDGGLQQLGAVTALLRELGATGVEVVALAKGGPGPLRHKVALERVFLPGRKNPVRLGPDSDELFLLSRARDEAHRFAIGYHRKLRRKAAVRSALEDVPGVGPVLRRRLLLRFGSLTGVRQAGPAALAEVPGVSAALAARIVQHLAEIASNR